MSNPFGGFGSTTTGGMTIFQDNPIDDPSGLRRTKRTEIPGKLPANKRTALGIITNQNRVGRVQPSRAAKQGPTTDGFLTLGNNENVNAKSAKTAFTIPDSALQTQTFSIHVDDENSHQVVPQINNTVEISSSSSSVDRLPLHPAVASLEEYSHHIGQNAIVIEDSPSRDSPMVLDTSLDAQRQLEEDTPEKRLDYVLSVAEYSDDIYRYLRLQEIKHRPKVGYMKKQPDITGNMRSILVDWLVEVAEEYKLHRETLCLAVNYLDRFLSQMSVLRGKLQLVGAASMFLAAKYEEIYPPEVGEFVYITDDTYTKKQVLRMEHLILKVLSFDVAIPTVNCFCEKFCKEMGADDRVMSLAMYLCELTLLDDEVFLKYLPSVIASAATCLACHTLNQEPWSAFMVQKTGYQVRDFESCLQDLYSAFCRAPQNPQQAIREKYKQSKYHQVATICPPSTLPSAVHQVQ